MVSTRASTSLKGEGGLYLFLPGASASLEGEEDLSHLCWVSTLKEGPALGVHSVSKYFGTKVALWCPRPWRDLNNSTVSSMGCLNTRATQPLSFCVWCPRLRRGLLPQYRIVLRESKNTKAECPEHQTLGLAIPTGGGGVPKESLDPCSGTRHPDFSLHLSSDTGASYSYLRRGRPEGIP